MRPHDRQINEMIESTMTLAHQASSLDLPVVCCLYRMILLELTNLAERKDDDGLVTALPAFEVGAAQYGSRRVKSG